MFEDSLIESQGRIRTLSRWFAVGSFVTQAALLLLLVLYPLLNPLALPRQSVERLLIAPPSPMMPAHAEPHDPTPALRRPLVNLQNQLQAPSRIPSHIVTINDAGGQAPEGLSDIVGAQTGPGVIGSISLGPPQPAVTLARPSAPKGPIHLSTGVVTGLLLSPIQPVYPAIAKAARIQGEVTITATISRQGTIENLQVVEGPSILRQAAIDAVTAARYRPYLLNGEPVEVETSIRIIFSLGG